jgi:osmotically-inducible protein OsmY
MTLKSSLITWTTVAVFGVLPASAFATQDKVEEAGQKTGNAIETAGQKTGDAVETAGQKSKDAAETAGEKTKDAVDKAAEKTGDAAVKSGAAVSDAWITTKIHAKFVDEDLLSDSHIDVDTDDHVVTLNGTVKSAAGRARAVEIARMTDGVTKVVDNLKVQ